MKDYMQEMWDLIGDFGDSSTDMFEQMEKGDWKDDTGHSVKLNTAMIQLLTTVSKAIQLREEMRKLGMECAKERV